MADVVDDYNDAHEEFITAELATRKATRVRGGPCTTCKSPAHLLQDGTVTKHCLTCWNEEYDTLPATLVEDLKKRGLTKK